MVSQTLVLIDGAFGEASGWRSVFDRLAGDGYAVLAPTNPLRSFSYDRTSSRVTEVQDTSAFVLVSQPDLAAGVIHNAGTGPCRKPGGPVTMVV